MRGEQPWKTNRARVLRSATTSAEAVLWQRLRSRRFHSLKFVRQFPIGNYIVDFACRDRKVIIEVDGATHSEPSDLMADERRTKELMSLGYRVFRVWNGSVYDNLDGVLLDLANFVGVGLD